VATEEGHLITLQEKVDAISGLNQGYFDCDKKLTGT
jgi:hypothetical protein